LERAQAADAAFQDHVQGRGGSPCVSRAGHLHAGSGPRARHRQVRRRRFDRDAAVPRARGAGAVLLERIGADAARSGGLLRSALQYRLHESGTRGPDQLPERAMNIEIRRSAVAFVALCATVSMSAAPPAHRNFVTCPIVRDTSTVPCWLAEYKGETYFLTLQTDVSAPVNPPQLGHQVLVEGVVSDEPRVCGGVVLKPVTLSVLPELDSSCSTMLPAEDRYNLTFEPPRPPGPSKGRLAFDNTPPPASPAPVNPSTREFVIQYDFDRLVGFSHAGPLSQILSFAQTV